MTAGHEARTLSVWINRDPQATYAFAGDPRNLTAWASGLGSFIEERDGAWVVETSHGPARLRFTEANPFGVLVPMLPMGLAGLWGARHGVYPPRPAPAKKTGGRR